MTTPTSLTLQSLRGSGFVVDVCERWVPIPGKNIRRDLFGVADIIAVDRREGGFLLVQCTSVAHVGDRLAKAKSKPGLAAWLKAGGRFEVWGWVRRGKTWQVKRVAVQAGELTEVPISVPKRRRKQNRQPMLF
jgi:hypothetical protein